MNKIEPVTVNSGVPKDALVMSASDYAEWEQFRAGINKPPLNRAQRRALERKKYK